METEDTTDKLKAPIVPSWNLWFSLIFFSFRILFLNRDPDLRNLLRFSIRYTYKKNVLNSRASSFAHKIPENCWKSKVGAASTEEAPKKPKMR